MRHLRFNSPQPSHVAYSHINNCHHAVFGFLGGSDLPAMREARIDFRIGKISWRKEWLPSPVSLHEEFHGQRSLVGCSPWDGKESDMTEWITLALALGLNHRYLRFFFFTSIIYLIKYVIYIIKTRANVYWAFLLGTVLCVSTILCASVLKTTLWRICS